MKKKVLFIILAILLIVVFFSGCSKTTKIDTEQLIIVTEIGGNGYGSIEAKISDYYVNSLTNYLDNPKNSKTDGNIILARKFYFDSLQLQIMQPNQNLSNGDIVEITIMADEELAKSAKLKLSDNVFKYQVSYLPELKVLDPFKNYQISFHGDNGEVMLVLLVRFL